MESTESNRELLANVTINDVTDVGAPQYMIQRMAVENSHLLGTELLQQHGSLVVDLGSGDFIPVNYTSEDLLSQDLTEEDRNLAAALVAVQLSQQHKQQQLHNEPNNMINTTLPSLVSNTGMDTTKVAFGDQQLILTDKATTAALNSGYLQIVSTEGLYVDKQMLPKLIDTRFNDDQEVQDRNEATLQIIKDEDALNLRDSDGENKCDNRSSKKSLPHKKRISRKLKKSCTTSKKLNKCNLCEQVFNTSEEFVEHQSLCQTIITPIHTPLFSCQLCTANFQDQLKFFEHLKAHYEPPMKQEQTNETAQNQKTNTKIEPDTQKDTLLATLLNNLSCISCNKTFRRHKAYEAHIRDVHSKLELNEFSEPEDLMEGIDVGNTNIHHSDDDTKTWYREDELHATEADLKELEALDHICHLCKQQFPGRSLMLEHLVSCRLSTNHAEQPSDVTHKKSGRKKNVELSCNICERVFTHRNSLVYHMRSHTGVRPHQCEQCGKSFFAASALKVHLRLHSGDKPYRCDDCGRNFRQWGDLKYHCVSIHSDEKQYQCEYCGKHFARKYSLIIHRRIHTGEKNYKCEFCDKTFRASSYLQNHRRIHTGEKPHPCEICGKPFRVRSDMKRHLKTHGRKKIGGKVYSDSVVTKIEENVLNEENSNDAKTSTKEEGTVTETLQYDEQDPLDEVREGNTLYSNGHQLFICYPGEIPVRNVESTSTWIQTD